MADNKQLYGKEFNQLAFSNLASGVSHITKTAVTGKQICLTRLDIANGAASQFKVFDGTTASTTILYANKLAAAGNFTKTFDPPIKNTEGNDLAVKITNVSGSTTINIGGFVI